MASSFSSSSSSMKFQLGFAMLLFLVGNGIMAQTLTPTFYAKTCPNALSIIKTAVTAAVSSETRIGASLLRLHFHDCFVNGCDGSVLLDGTSSEKSATANSNSLRGFEVVDSIKSKLETACAGVVSCADVLVVAARDSVVALGGPSWKVLLGRRDSATASLTAANSDLPSPFSDLAVLLSDFSKKGFNAKETVALSGAHTIGNARCIVFRNRTYNAANIDASFATSLKTNCPATGGDTNVANLDVTTPTSFDNGYFKSLVAKKGLLHSDQELFNGGSTDAQVTAYSNNLKNFNADFGNAMVKMGNLGPLTGTSGQIRTNCRVAN